MSDDFSMGQAMGDTGGGGQPSPEEQNAGAAVAATGSYLQKTAENAKNQQAMDQMESIYNAKTHTWDYKNVPHDAVQAITQNAMQFGHITQVYQQQIERNQQQQEQLRQHPFANALAQIAANVAASSKDPLVRGLGGAAQALNPTMGQLQGQGMELMQGAEKAGEGQMRILEQMDQHQAMQRSREDALAQKTALAKDQTAKTFHELSTSAQKGELTDPAITSKVLQDAGHPKDRADSLAALLVGASKEKQSLLKQAQEATALKDKTALDERARESDRRIAAYLAAAAPKISDKADADKAIEETAKSIAAGDLSSIKDISSFRGSERTKIYARAKEINPNFSVAETKRKIDMEQSFTVGKDGQALQSFGTFLEHAGEATKALEGVYQSGSPAINKPMNWIRKNMEGNPEYQRLIVSLEPVGKEFESFLLNQRALYVDDRKRIEIMLDGNSTPAQIKVALNQMGKTAKDRYSEMNQRYKRTMKHDLEDSFGPEATAGAAKIGIDVGSSGAAKKLIFNPKTGKIEEQ
jgi:hypothetical protein